MNFKIQNYVKINYIIIQAINLISLLQTNKINKAIIAVNFNLIVKSQKFYHN